MRERDGRHKKFGNADRQRCGDIQSKISPHGTAEHQHAVHPALPESPQRQFDGATRHRLHRDILVGRGSNLFQRMTCRARHLSVGDIRHEAGLLSHADIHNDRLAASLQNAIAQERDFIWLGINGADDQHAIAESFAIDVHEDAF